MIQKFPAKAKQDEAKRGKKQVKEEKEKEKEEQEKKEALQKKAKLAKDKGLSPLPLFYQYARLCISVLARLLMCCSAVC